MRKCILFFAMFFSVVLYGQESYKISSVIQCEGINAEQAYQNAELWLINTFNAPDKVIQLQDKQNKRLAVKAGTSFASHRFDAGAVRGILIYTINIFFRDGRFKVDMVNIQHEANPDMMNPQSLGIIYNTELPPKKIFGMTKKWRKDVYDDIKSKISEEYSNFCQDLLAAIKYGARSDNEDW